MKSNSSAHLKLAAIAVAMTAVGAFLLNLPPRAWTDPISPDLWRTLFNEFRIPRAGVVLLVGALLGWVGHLCQALFKNPLATPYSIGFSGIFALVYVTLIVLFPELGSSRFPLYLILVGAVVGLWAWRSLRKSERVPGIGSLLLFGQALGFFAAGAIVLVQYWAQARGSFSVSQELLTWLLGGIRLEERAGIGFLGVVLAVGVPIAFLRAHAWNRLVFSDDEARALGVNPVRERVLMVFLIAIASAAVVTVAGPLGFVGLIWPYVVRHFIGWDLRAGLLWSALLGGAFLLLCDSFNRWVLGPNDPPLGVLTALLGVPVMIWLARRSGPSLRL